MKRINILVLLLIFTNPLNAEDIDQSAKAMCDMAVITHNIENSSLEDNIAEITQRITANFEGAEKDLRLQILAELEQFEFGRYLIMNRGVNGYWTDYLFEHVKTGRVSGLDKNGISFSSLENFLLNKAPLILATQQRFKIFQEVLSREIQDYYVVASIPCGLMGDLLTLELKDVQNVHFVGLDIDNDSLQQAAQRAYKLGFQGISFGQANAWNLEMEDFFDIITSNGLNMYEPNHDRLIALYKEFFKSLKSGGLLLISFFPPPPMVDENSIWDMSQVNLDDLVMQRMIFVDLLQVKYNHFITEDKIKAQLSEVGFVDFDIIYDKAKMFPTILARKPSQGITPTCKRF